MDREAFERLCREHYRSVLRTAYLLTGDPEDAADLAQETFARAFENWSTISQLDRPEAWLFRVVGNLSRSWWRRLRVRRAHRDPIEPTIEPPEPPDAELVAALRSLSESQRTAVVLRFFLDLSIEDVATALGKKPGTIRALTAQGIARLRRILPEEEVVDEDSRPT